MPKELISRATRNEFREVFSGYCVLREIEMIFQAADIAARDDVDPQVGGQRRTLVERYYGSLDLSLPSDVRRLLVAFEELIERLLRIKARVDNPNLTQNTIDTLLRRMERDGFRYENGRFTSDALHLKVVQTSSLIALSEESISEQVEKARTKIDAQDYSGAIASAYTLLEEFMKELLRRTDTPFKADEGDIRNLYSLVMDVLNLNPKGEGLESYLKTILQGLRSQVSGFYELANKASDRHARRYHPAKHHAKLAVNAAFTLCEFLLDSHVYQRAKVNESSDARPNEK